jgi:hypothetical protein
MCNNQPRATPHDLKYDLVTRIKNGGVGIECAPGEENGKQRQAPKPNREHCRDLRRNVPENDDSCVCNNWFQPWEFHGAASF